MAYCTKDDLLIGDIPLAAKYGDGTAFVNFAADEIDSIIGRVYITPVVFDESTPALTATARPAKLLLKRINILLASGRIILDMAAGGEDSQLHAYGYSMWKEACDLLYPIGEGKVNLIGAPLLDSTVDDPNTAVSIHQDDPYSLVEGFYQHYSNSPYVPVYGQPAPMRPYDDVPTP